MVFLKYTIPIDAEIERKDVKFITTKTVWGKTEGVSKPQEGKENLTAQSFYLGV